MFKFLSKKQPSLKLLEEISKELESNFYNINYGGCCVVAGYLALYLRHHFQDVKIAVKKSWLDWEDIDIEEIRHYISDPFNDVEWEANGLHFHHVLVSFIHKGREYLADSGGYYKKGDYADIHDGYLTIGEAIALGKYGNWNDDFDRSQIPAMKKTITRMFRNVCN